MSAEQSQKISDRNYHDFLCFMHSLTEQISSEYERIHKRASEDPGTAGDQGEENWAGLLREWLPPNYHVVTKGRIINNDGKTSPQVDVIVLKPSYPKALLSTKLYLFSGVAAAFECKVTLRADDIKKAMKNSYEIQSMSERRRGSPYKELYSPLFYGLLAHSHNWSGELLETSLKIYQLIYDADLAFINHPYQMLDILCVANQGTWGAWKYFNGPEFIPGKPVHTLYSWHTYLDKDEKYRATPIGDMIVRVWKRLAWEDTTIRDLAQNFLAISGLASSSGGGFGGDWTNDVFSELTKEKVEKHFEDFHTRWNEWDSMFDAQMGISFESS